MSDPHGPELLIADRALQSVPFLESSGNGVLWQAGTEIWIKRSSSTPAVLSENGLFPAVAGREGSDPVVAWEGNVGDEKTIFADVLE